ncbi:MAG: FtsX-like permease family protein [Treponema sp.]|nr:FtsX-like permease family protein [Treponema sp.]
MPVILRLAIRNLKEHKSKTVIIALFLIFGIAIVIMGNAFLESINRGLEKDFRANYTGDIVISAKPEKGYRIEIFGVGSNTVSMDLPQIPALTDLDKAMEILNSNSSFASNTKLISAKVIVADGIEVDFAELTEDDNLTFDDLPISMLFAGEDETYWNTFSGINFVEGGFPAPNTDEIIIDTRVQRAFKGLYKKDLHLGDTVLLAGANTNGVIREAKVVGIFKPANEYSAMFQIIYCNPSFARSFADLTYANLQDNSIPDSIDLSLSDLSEDDLFGSDDDFDFDFDFGIDENTDVLGSVSDFDNILGDTTLRDELNKTDDGAWQFILLKMKNPYETKKMINTLRKEFDDAGLNLQVMGWKAAAASYSESIEGIGVVFNMLVIILAVVVFIIIMNTMTVSVIERTGEIGTMRAIGAEKGFVRKLFFAETVSLTFISSIIGIILAFIAMAIFNSCGITITNSIAKMILGGGLLHFTPTPAIIISSFVIAILGSVLSNLYPVSSALRITPLKALAKGSE